MIALLACEIAEIKAVRALVGMAEFNAWFDTSKIKERAKKACMEAQRLRCCYCHKFKPTIYNNEWDLEHVLCEKTYPQFFATPRNLAVACKACNIAKKHADVLVPPNPAIKKLPAASKRYSIPHPSIDRWKDHLDHVNYQIYRPVGHKGTALIDLCKLNEMAVVQGGLDYNSVVAAMRNNFFATFGGVVDPKLPDANVLAHIAEHTVNTEDEQAKGYLAALKNSLATLEKQAAKRTPEETVAKLEKAIMEKAMLAEAKALLKSKQQGPGLPALPAPPEAKLLPSANKTPRERR